jgi:hypothetical protein
MKSKTSPLLMFWTIIAVHLIFPAVASLAPPLSDDDTFICEQNCESHPDIKDGTLLVTNCNYKNIKSMRNNSIVWPWYCFPRHGFWNLDVSHNLITELVNISTMDQIQDLILHHNEIRNISDEGECHGQADHVKK